MTIAQALQEAGFNKYEAEAYNALSVHGPLTGYEVGKRSSVPLSRSYEILEHLLEQGWVLRQPGEPPRYAALSPAATLERFRHQHLLRFTNLTDALSALTERPHPAGFWVLKGREAILAQVRTCLAQAHDQVTLALASLHLAEVASVVPTLPSTVSLIHRPPPGGDPDACAACFDGQTVLIGRLAPESLCQVLMSTDPVLVALVQMAAPPSQDAVPPAPLLLPGTDWLAWERRKQFRLRQSAAS